MPIEVDDRRTRLIVFVVITLVFVVSVAALLYWAINVAAARISSRTTAHFDALNPLAVVAEKTAVSTSESVFNPHGCVTASQVF